MTLTSTKCKRCRTSFRYPKEYGKVEFCSALCRVTYYRISEGPELKGCGKRYSKRRRAIMAQGDKIDPYVVFLHFDWKCYICGGKINPDLTIPHPMAATMDHIKPLAHGGKHTWDNVAPAHCFCNELKSDELTEEDSKVTMVT